MLFYAINSPDTPFQDEIGHYLLSRYAWQYPEYLLHIWGRPFNTLIFMVPALGGLFAARLFAILLSALTVLLTTKVAQAYGIKQLVWIPLFLWFQPWFVNVSSTANTMIPFSFLLILGVYLWQRDRYILVSVVMSLLPLTRHEGIALTGVWFLYAVYHKHWLAATIVPLPMILHNGLYLAVFGTLASGNLINFQPTTYYGSGGWFHYFSEILAGIYPILLFLTCMAIPAIPYRSRRSLIFVPYVLYLATHVVIYRFGLFASGGYGFFLLPLAPAFAMWSTVGMLQLIKMTRRSRVFSQRFIVAIVVGVVLLGALTYPFREYTQEASSLRDASDWLYNNNYGDFPFHSTHVWFYHFSGLEVKPDKYWGTSNTNSDQPGTILVWDKHYSDRGGYKYNQLTASDSGWSRLAEFGDGTVVIFQKNE